jgi:hypothetical protein
MVKVISNPLKLFPLLVFFQRSINGSDNDGDMDLLLVSLNKVLVQKKQGATKIL